MLEIISIIEITKDNSNKTPHVHTSTTFKFLQQVMQVWDASCKFPSSQLRQHYSAQIALLSADSMIQAFSSTTTRESQVGISGNIPSKDNFTMRRRSQTSTSHKLGKPDQEECYPVRSQLGDTVQILSIVHKLVLQYSS